MPNPIDDERKPRTVLQLIFQEGQDPSKTSRLETPEEVEERIKRRKADEAYVIYQEKNAKALNCDKCGQYICEVYENDLNGSRFYHKDCINK